MPQITLSDGRKLSVRRISDIQLTTDLNLEATRTSPLIALVIKVDTQSIEPTKLVIGDHHSLWLNHQSDVIPRKKGYPSVPTGLTANEGILARALFESLDRNRSVLDETPNRSNFNQTKFEEVAVISDTPQTKRKASRQFVLEWIGKHIGQVLVAVVTALILAWLGLNK